MPDLATPPPSPLIPLLDAASDPAMPRRAGGKPIPGKTLRRWAAEGRLRSVKVNGRRFTSGQWIREMVDVDAPAPPPGRTPSQRKREHARAAAALAGDGL